MIGLSFKSISYKNFLSVGEVPVTLELEDPGSYLFIGLNGAGKSTMVDAITYALFGKPYRKINKPKLVNSINKKNMLVELEFDSGPNKYLIRRGMKPNIFEVFCNGVLLNQDSDVRDYQGELEKKILKMNYAAARQIVLLSKTSYKPFMELDTKERRPFVEDLLGIEIFSVMGKLLSTRVSDAKKRMTDLQKDIEHTSEKIDIIRNNVARFVQNTEDLVSGKNERISGFRQDLEIALSEIATLEPQVRELQIKYQEAVNRSRLRRDKLMSIRSQVESRKRNISRDLQFFEHTSECPTCSQEIDEGYKIEAITKRRATLSDLDVALLEADQRLEQVAALDNDISDDSQLLDKQNNQIIRHRTTIQHCRSSIAALEREIEELKNQTSEYDADYAKIDELQTSKKKLTKEKKNLLEQTELYRAATFLLKDTGIKAQIIKQYVPIINKFINKYLASMDFFVEFQLDENFDEVILSRHRDEFSYHSFSEGEKFRIDLALMLTWRAVARMRNNCAANILFMDEIFDASLDAPGIEDLLKIVDTLISEGTGVYVISHKGEQLIDKFESILRFEKIKNFTQLVEE